jgi:hypothetical protein
MGLPRHINSFVQINVEGHIPSQSLPFYLASPSLGHHGANEHNREGSFCKGPDTKSKAQDQKDLLPI